MSFSLSIWLAKFIFRFGHSFVRIGCHSLGVLEEKKMGPLRFQGYLIKICPIRSSSDLTYAEISIPSGFGSTEHIPLIQKSFGCLHPCPIFAHSCLLYTLNPPPLLAP